MKAQLALFDDALKEKVAGSLPMHGGMQVAGGNVAVANRGVEDGISTAVDHSAELEEEVFVPSVSCSEVSEEE